jgi:hypothetical protein
VIEALAGASEDEVAAALLRYPSTVDQATATGASECQRAPSQPGKGASASFQWDGTFPTPKGHVVAGAVGCTALRSHFGGGLALD